MSGVNDHGGSIPSSSTNPAGYQPFNPEQPGIVTSDWQPSGAGGRKQVRVKAAGDEATVQVVTQNIFNKSLNAITGRNWGTVTYQRGKADTDEPLMADGKILQEAAAKIIKEEGDVHTKLKTEIASLQKAHHKQWTKTLNLAREYTEIEGLGANDSWTAAGEDPSKNHASVRARLAGMTTQNQKTYGDLAKLIKECDKADGEKLAELQTKVAELKTKSEEMLKKQDALIEQFPVTARKVQMQKALEELQRNLGAANPNPNPTPTPPSDPSSSASSSSRTEPSSSQLGISEDKDENDEGIPERHRSTVQHNEQPEHAEGLDNKKKKKVRFKEDTDDSERFEEITDQNRFEEITDQDTVDESKPEEKGKEKKRNLDSVD